MQSSSVAAVANIYYCPCILLGNYMAQCFHVGVNCCSMVCLHHSRYLFTTSNKGAMAHLFCRDSCTCALENSPYPGLTWAAHQLGVLDKELSS